MAPPNLQLALLHMDSIWPVCFPLEQLQGSQHRSTMINISNCFTGLHCFEESLSWWILIIHAVITCNYFMSWSARSAALHDRCKCQGTFRSMTQMSGSAVRPALSARADSKARCEVYSFLQNWQKIQEGLKANAGWIGTGAASVDLPQISRLLGILMYTESLLVLAILSWDILGCVASGHKPSISTEKVKLKCKTPGISNCHLFVCNDITQGSRHVQTCTTNWTAAPQNSWKSNSSHLQTLQELGW